MEFSSEIFNGTVGLLGLVILLAALLSGLIERSGVPQIAVLLALGAALGPPGLAVLDITLDSPILRIVATLGLTLVLFTDAVRLDLREVREHSHLALIMVGPGTLLSAALISLAGWQLLGLQPIAAVILGAALASTDPILLRGMLRNSGLGNNARLALRLEGGMNDVSLLPVVIVAVVLWQSTVAVPIQEWAAIGISLFILGPGAGIMIGLFSVAVLDLVRRRIGIRRDYESLYAIGVAFTAFAAAERVGGSGFLAAFAAGLTVSALDIELCDCFLEYGETTAELILLFTFVLFGSALIWSGLTLISLPIVLFALVVLLGRLPILYAALSRTGLDNRTRLMIGWFGPRGLGSLLLVLLPVFAGIAGSEQLFAICSLMVLLSVALHGGTPLLLRWLPARKFADNEPEPRTRDETTPFIAHIADAVPPPDAAGPRNGACSPNSSGVADNERITLAEIRRLQAAGQSLILLDSRTLRSRSRSELQAAGSLRLPPDRVAERAIGLGLPRNAWLVPYCT
jgi:sodium/hydrogen antiporter